MKRRYAAIDPNIQRAIAAEWCPGVRGFGAASLAQQFNLPRGTVKSVLKRAKLHGDPVTERGHRGRKLDERQEARLQQTLDANTLHQQSRPGRCCGRSYRNTNSE